MLGDELNLELLETDYKHNHILLDSAYKYFFIKNVLIYNFLKGCFYFS